MNSPGQLYDALFSLESQFRSGAYPIHKRLRFGEEKIDDIYDWIVRHSDISGNGAILDAGCGVGFGTLRLAAHGNAKVVGISVSDEEVRQARKNVKDAGCEDRAVIVRKSYDNLDEGMFDIVVAVESLKHSFDVKKSIQSIVRALKPGGRMVIVEDLFCGPEQHPSAIQMADDWALARNLRESDFVNALGAGRIVITDLTSYAKVSGNIATTASLLAVQALLIIGPRKHAQAVQAFRGGIHLQRLYAEQFMHYKSIEFTKNAATES